MFKPEPGMESQSPSTTASANAGFNPAEASRSDVDEILRRKRKAREYKACYPCRQRKVKCDQAVPCKTCIAREHPELCTYHPPAESHPPAKRMNHGQAVPEPANGDGNALGAGIQYNVNGTVTIGREDWERLCSKLNTVERSLVDLKSTIKQASESSAAPSQNGHHHIPESAASTPSKQQHHDGQVTSQGIHTTNSITGQTVHLGSSSVPALVMSLGKGEGGSAPVQELLGKNVLPLFGLDNESATYPFVDLWGLPHGSMSRIYELCNALPNDSDCWNLLKYHKETAHTVFPAIADIDKLESELLRFLIARGGSTTDEDGSISGVTEQTIYGKDLHWVGLLFAVLASGCQCSAMPRKERELTSQVYICCSFECLRITNFLSHSNLETIQTLLILGNVMSNNMNAGVAWSLLERNERARMLLEKLISVLTEITSKVDPTELSTPVTRSMIALRKLLNLQDASKQQALMASGQSMIPNTATAASTPNMTGYSIDEINGALIGDDGTFGMNQSPLMADLDSEASPYALMDSIIWGVKRTPPG
ncbi:putative c6 transcription protein [Neofusicoccum parvum UCRNP2]|uniref:Putative c6 transcription protein n=1 Tax=Botryosphaeria parva (strain UCR-NP2) TaxID=1287680 RepID=R1G491_BOTPV|nr:putative c6 transcription protein [Neofusicoccum parvum UCRNP2]